MIISREMGRSGSMKVANSSFDKSPRFVYRYEFSR